MLVDVTKSYDAAIVQTVGHVLAGLGVPFSGMGRETIEGFKATGGFNDEVDLAYSVILGITGAARAGRDPEKFLRGVIANADSTGVPSVERYVAGQADVSDTVARLSYPGKRHSNAVYRTFDQLFYGPGLYEKLYGVRSEFAGPGLIENDEVILDTALCGRLRQRFGEKIAMVTGRGRASVSHSLGDLLSVFDLKSSAFLEDELRELAKPNPSALIASLGSLSSRLALYVGDSAEDLLMANRTAETGLGVLFCGITGTGNDPEARLRLFSDNGAALVLDSISLLPKALNLQ